METLYTVCVYIINLQLVSTSLRQVTLSWQKMFSISIMFFSFLFFSAQLFEHYVIMYVTDGNI